MRQLVVSSTKVKDVIAKLYEAHEELTPGWTNQITIGKARRLIQEAVLVMKDIDADLSLDELLKQAGLV